MIRKIILLLLCSVSLRAPAQVEHVLNFHSDISIDSTGLVKVTEHIKVYATGDRISHGIVRFIPLYRKDVYGNQKRIDFEIVEVQRDGKQEDYHTDDDDMNRKIFLGSPDVILQEGTYQYLITYQSHGHVGFFDKYDELYWNVTGNNWDFPIDSASATISFPAGAKSENIFCYTGVSGATSSNCSNTSNADGSVTFKSGKRLNSGEGLTVAVAFTKGIIKRPGLSERIYNDYGAIFFGALMLLVFGTVYYLLWAKFGRDPRKPVVIPTFNVPNNFSPGVMRYFYKKGYDDKATSAALIGMAVKNAIKITSPKGSYSTYRFDKYKADVVLTTEEQVLYDQLFASCDSITTAQSNAEEFVKARGVFAKSLSAQVGLKKYYKSNGWMSVILFVLAMAALAVYTKLLDYDKALLLVILLPALTISFSLIAGGIKALGKSTAPGIVTVIFGVVFGFIVCGIGYSFAITIAPVAFFVALLMAVMFTIFIFSISAFTVEGIAIQSNIEGFRLYLSTAEEHRLDLLNPPEHTPEVFERFLPYAIALDLENAWAKKFQSILENTDYQPGWYVGNNRSYYVFVSHSMSDSFYSSVSVSPPGSSSGSSGSGSFSSGSSGGGSSGGGGGGGGGGGW